MSGSEKSFCLGGKSLNFLNFSGCDVPLFGHPGYLGLKCWLEFYCHKNTQKKVKARGKKRERERNERHWEMKTWWDCRCCAKRRKAARSTRWVTLGLKCLSSVDSLLSWFSLQAGLLEGHLQRRRGVFSFCPHGVVPPKLVHERLWKVGPLNTLFVSEDPAPGPETPDTVIIINDSC